MFPWQQIFSPRVLQTGWSINGDRRWPRQSTVPLNFRRRAPHGLNGLDHLSVRRIILPANRLFCSLYCRRARDVGKKSENCLGRRGRPPRIDLPRAAERPDRWAVQRKARDLPLGPFPLKNLSGIRMWWIPYTQIEFGMIRQSGLPRIQSERA